MNTKIKVYSLEHLLIRCYKYKEEKKTLGEDIGLGRGLDRDFNIWKWVKKINLKVLRLQVLSA